MSKRTWQDYNDKEDIKSVPSGILHYLQNCPDFLGCVLQVMPALFGYKGRMLLRAFQNFSTKKSCIFSVEKLSEALMTYIVIFHPTQILKTNHKRNKNSGVAALKKQKLCCQ